jgi:hypothetical protein
MKRSFAIFAVAVVCLALAGSVFAENSPFAGTWKVNLEKSKFPAGKAPKSLTRTITADGDTMTYKFEGVGGDGAAIDYGFKSKYDGMDTEVMGAGAPWGADHISIKKQNSHMVSVTLKKGDKTVATGSATVSHDGKMTTVILKGADASGKPMKSESIYDKQ